MELRERYEGGGARGKKNETGKKERGRDESGKR